MENRYEGREGASDAIDPIRLMKIGINNTDIESVRAGYDRYISMFGESLGRAVADGVMLSLLLTPQEQEAILMNEPRIENKSEF